VSLRAVKDRKSEPMLVRVIDYTLDDGRANPETYRVFTTRAASATSVSMADLIELAGCAGVEKASGRTVPFTPGRTDAA
jgi:hypothetical protein